MSVEIRNLLAGPAVVYWGAYGAAEPLDSELNSAPAASAWTDIGATSGGTTLNVELEFVEFEIDQSVDCPGQMISKRATKVATSVAELTLTNWKRAMNGGTLTTGASYDTYDPTNSTAGMVPDYGALIIDGFAPSMKRRRVVVRRVLNTAAFELANSRTDQGLIPVEWMAHYVSDSVTPYHVIDGK